jgi:hypothetical protein
MVYILYSPQPLAPFQAADEARRRSRDEDVLSVQVQVQHQAQLEHLMESEKAVGKHSTQAMGEKANATGSPYSGWKGGC